jgi:hypothetical protein
MSTPICNPCIGIPCDNPPDLAAGIDGAIYSAIDYSFIVQCPPHCFCPPGLFPQTISILASTIPPVVPPITEPGDQIILRLQGCSAIIVRTLDSTATQTDINAAAQSMQAEWAGQQALCNAKLVPGVNCTPSDSIDVCNDPFSFVCAYSGVTINVPAGVRCQTLSTVGLTDAQIATAVAQIKASLNELVQEDNCAFGHFFCGATITTNPGGNGVVSVLAHNVGATNFDTSSFQLFANAGFLIGNSVTPTVAPGVTNVLISASPVTLPFNIRYKGVVIYSGDSSSGLSVTVTFIVCNP